MVIQQMTMFAHSNEPLFLKIPARNLILQTELHHLGQYRTFAFKSYTIPGSVTRLPSKAHNPS